jgi:6-phosphofructokinase 1
MLTLPAPEELTVARLSAGRVPSARWVAEGRVVDDEQVLVSADTAEVRARLAAGEALPSFEAAGLRRLLHFDPAGLTCGIVTCGGLCPGVNNVIRAIVLTLTYAFPVRRIVGFRYGYAGLVPDGPHEPMVLTTEVVDRIHEHGGTILGTSRGPQDVGRMVDMLAAQGIGVLFAIGGDGTLRGASALVAEIRRRGLDIAVVGVPKTIDNDIHWVERSFGFATAVEAARHVLECAHEEARGAWNGVGLVKLMGRHSGFIAAHATLACYDVNFCLVPEVPFALEGEHGFLALLERRLDAKHHAVIAVAEGAGQDLFGPDAARGRDRSGNVRLLDVGALLRERIAEHFATRRKDVQIKYIDPSYTVRSLAANAVDAEFCLALGQHAVHAGLAGRTDLMIGYWNQRFTHVPIALATGGRRRLLPDGPAWQRVRAATGQPAWMGVEPPPN